MPNHNADLATLTLVSTPASLFVASVRLKAVRTAVLDIIADDRHM